MKKGLFITLEGPDGSGKSTHSLLLYNYLKGKRYEAIHTREPGGTLFTEYIRKILLNPKLKILPLTELLLYTASRAQHTVELINPVVKKGKIVICERYNDATVAYQGYGRRLNLRLIHQLNKIATGGLEPDLTILLDVSAKKGLNRVKKSKKKDRLEQEKISFHSRVRKGYLNLAKKHPERIKLISTTSNIKETHKKIIDIIEKFLKSKK